MTGPPGDKLKAKEKIKGDHVTSESAESEIRKALLLHLVEKWSLKWPVFKAQVSIVELVLWRPAVRYFMHVLNQV